LTLQQTLLNSAKAGTLQGMTAAQIEAKIKEIQADIEVAKKQQQTQDKVKQTQEQQRQAQLEKQKQDNAAAEAKRKENEINTNPILKAQNNQKINDNIKFLEERNKTIGDEIANIRKNNNSIYILNNPTQDMKGLTTKVNAKQRQVTIEKNAARKKIYSDELTALNKQFSAMVDTAKSLNDSTIRNKETDIANNKKQIDDLKKQLK
jgi:chromosome segregation ATPase